ncbi:LamG-like jellyroll fold domain-containing protein [Lachnospiraceae bacterium 66-29]
MKYKKIVSGLLACAMVVTSVFTGNVTTAKAAEQPTPVGTYDFNTKESQVSPDLGNGVTAKSSCGVNSDILLDYNDPIKYVPGRSGKAGDYAVDTQGKHGLILPEKQLGDNYTISFWVKPTDISKGKWATSLLFVGRHTSNNEKWVSIATRDNTGAVACWSTGNRQNGDITVVQDEWQMITLVQRGTDADVYLNGEKKFTKAGAWDKGMEDADQFIALATNKWDGNFYGCYDDVNVYNQALTEDQVRYLYLGTDDKSEILQNFTATETLELVEGQEGQIETTIPTGIEESEVTFSYQSKSENIATVDATGKVTAKVAGTATITTTATLANNGGTAKKETTVTVKTKGDVLAEKGITVDKTMLLAEGEHQTIKVTLPEGLTKDDVTLTFESSDPTKATVDATGKVTAVAAGETDITTTAASKSDAAKKATATTKVTVRGAVQATIDYNFNDSALPADVEVVGKGAAASTATPAFDTGRTGETTDKAIKLGDYGLQLPVENIGSKYTVSVWVNPSAALVNNQAVMLAGDGTAEAEEWVAFAGENGNTTTTNKVKLWSNSQASGENNYAHQTYAQPEVPVNAWTMLTLTQDGSTLKFYKNGTLVKTQEGVTEALNGVGRKLFVGATYWGGDDLFKGLVDDIVVYSDVLSDGEVRKLFVGDKTEEELLGEGEITAAPSKLSVKIAESKDFTITLPDGVTTENAEITYTSGTPAVATVAKDNENPLKATVTGVAAGDAVITAKVKIGTTTKETTVTVKVNDPSAEKPEVAADYDFAGAQTGDNTLVDKSENGNDAWLEGNNITFKDGVMTLGDQSYVELPLEIMDSLDDKEKFTIEIEFAKNKNCGNNAWLFCLGSKVKSSGTNYMFLSPNFEGKTLRSGIKNSSTEKLFATSTQPEIDKTYTVNMVFDHGTIRLYWNGIQVKGDDGNELKSGYSIMDDVVTPGTENGVLGFIGRSCWAPDGYYQGKVSKFKVYNKALTNDEVQEAYREPFEKNFKDNFTVDKILGSKNPSKDEVKYNLPLPSTFEEMPITWKTSNKDVITEKGIVKNQAADTQVTLTAEVGSGILTAETTFTLTVKPADKTALTTAVAEAKKALDDPYRSDNSKAKIKALVEKAEAVLSQTEVDTLVKNIEKAIANKEYSDLYLDPFTEIDKVDLVKENVSVMPKGTVSVMNKAVPTVVKDIVTVTYKSQTPSVATVNSSGTVTGVKAGYALILTTVTAKSDGYAVEYQTLVKVDLDVKQITAKAKKAKLPKGKTTTISVTYPKTYSTALKNSAKVAYRATGAVSVNKSGRITAKKAGTGKVYVKVSLAGKSITKTVTVKVGEITGPTSVKIKKSIQLKVKGISGKVKWSLDKKGKKLAKITQKGKLTALKKAGKVKVTAKVGGVTMTKTITIKKK